MQKKIQSIKINLQYYLQITANRLAPVSKIHNNLNGPKYSEL